MRFVVTEKKAISATFSTNLEIGGVERGAYFTMFPRYGGEGGGGGLLLSFRYGACNRLSLYHYPRSDYFNYVGRIFYPFGIWILASKSHPPNIAVSKLTR